MIRVKGEENKEGGGKPMDNGASSYHRFRENGDETGLVEIIRDYKDGLIFFLYGIVNDLYLAEELAEDTFVLLGTKKPRDNKKGSFKTWLYTIGRHIAIAVRKGIDPEIIAKAYKGTSPDNAAWLEKNLPGVDFKGICERLGRQPISEIEKAQEFILNRVNG